MLFLRACATPRAVSSVPVPRQPQQQLRPAAWALPLLCGVLRHPVSGGPTSASRLLCACHAAFMKQQQRPFGIVLQHAHWQRTLGHWGGRAITQSRNKQPQKQASDADLRLVATWRCIRTPIAGSVGGGQATLRRGSAAVRHTARPRLFRYLRSFRHAHEPTAHAYPHVWKHLGGEQAPGPWARDRSQSLDDLQRLSNITPTCSRETEPHCNGTGNATAGGSVVGGFGVGLVTALITQHQS